MMRCWFRRLCCISALMVMAGEAAATPGCYAYYLSGDMVMLPHGDNDCGEFAANSQTPPANISTDDLLARLDAMLLPGANVQIPQTPYDETIDDLAATNRLDPVLVKSVIQVESGFDETAVSRKGASGLMQLMPATAKRFGIKLQEIFNPVENLKAGIQYIRFLLDRFDENLHLALAAYNAGENAVDRYGGIPPYKETQQYVSKVIRIYKTAITEQESRSITGEI